MKNLPSPIRLTALLACVALSASCTTSYDAYGNPKQTVDPGVAIMGVAAAGLIGYALADDDDNYCNSGNYYGGGYGGGRYSRGGYGGGYSHCR
jgi:uncharacterized membrane protein